VEVKIFRSVWEIAKFLCVLVAVLLCLQYYGMVDIIPGQVTIIDGDSFREGKTEIRLHGIDAPEYRQTCFDRDHVEYACGKRAAEALRQLVRQGELKCRSLELDRYGRSVSTCNIGTLDVNREMVAQGWAVAFIQFGADYVGVEKTARQNKIGLWAGTFEEPYRYRQRLRSVNGDVAALQDLPPD
jgi:endonuclease YncB( thermonuclease family)